MVQSSMVLTSASGWGSCTWTQVTAARRLHAAEVACSQATMKGGSMCAPSQGQSLMKSRIEVKAAACLG